MILWVRNSWRVWLVIRTRYSEVVAIRCKWGCSYQCSPGLADQNRYARALELGFSFLTARRPEDSQTSYMAAHRSKHKCSNDEGEGCLAIHTCVFNWIVLVMHKSLRPAQIQGEEIEGPLLARQSVKDLWMYVKATTPASVWWSAQIIWETTWKS